MSEDRLVDIEVKLAHQDQLLDDLNEVVTQQQAKILEQRTDEAMETVRTKTVEAVCARAGLATTALAGLAPPQLGPLRRQVISTLIDQLG